MALLDDDFLLKNDMAKKLFNDHAKKCQSLISIVI